MTASRLALANRLVPLRSSGTTPEGGGLRDENGGDDITSSTPPTRGLTLINLPASCEICYDAERAYTTFLSFFEQLYKNTKGSDTYRALSSLQARAVRTSNRLLRELTSSPPLRPLTQGGDGGRGGWGTSWRRRGDPQIQTRDSPPIINFIT